MESAVISVRVRLNEPQSAFENEEDQESDNGNIPTVPGSPMERFFQQFGFDHSAAFTAISKSPVRVRDFSSRLTVTQ